ncbi:MAG: helix-turn-helix transcriptional regulator [Symploca sp. SIO2E9]|nr:helix-turn-helix transcriptional regulator [Symploca sp. SIO2E9]
MGDLKLFCRLAVLMKEKDPGLTQIRLAEHTGIAPSTIGRLHNNRFTRVDKATIERLCKYFQCNLEDLFDLRESA